MPGRICAAAIALLALGGCQESEVEPIRPADQPLERLATPEARQRIEATSAAFPAAGTAMGDSACTEILRVSEQGRLVLDRSDPARLLVHAEYWDRVPAEARTAIVRCAEAGRAAGASGPMQVVPALPED